VLNTTAAPDTSTPHILVHYYGCQFHLPPGVSSSPTLECTPPEASLSFPSSAHHSTPLCPFHKHCLLLSASSVFVVALNTILSPLPLSPAPQPHKSVLITVSTRTCVPMRRGGSSFFSSTHLLTVFFLSLFQALVSSGVATSLHNEARILGLCFKVHPSSSPSHPGEVPIKM